MFRSKLSVLLFYFLFYYKKIIKKITWKLFTLVHISKKTSKSNIFLMTIFLHQTFPTFPPFNFTYNYYNIYFKKIYSQQQSSLFYPIFLIDDDTFDRVYYGVIAHFVHYKNKKKLLSCQTLFFIFSLSFFLNIYFSSSYMATKKKMDTMHLN